MSKIIVFTILLLCVPSVYAQAIVENPLWNSQFISDSVTGVFVLCKGSTQSCVTNNKARALTPYLPASTFKIPNALIALDTGVIKNAHQIFKWDGKPRGRKQWERDLTLREAVQVSAVPVFQQIARDIGATRMQRYLRKFSYGNANIDGGIDKFWLEGQLRISAQNQVIFLESLYLNKLPASTVNQYIVKDAMVSDATPEYIIHSKTGYSGTGTELSPGIAWWVGWIEKDAEVYFFAFNMDINSESKLPYRKSIPLKLLADEGVAISGADK